MDKSFTAGHSGSLPGNVAFGYGQQVDYFKNFRKLVADIVSIPDTRDMLIMEFLIKETPRIFLISKDEFLNSQRHSHARARACAFYLIRKHTKHSCRKIAKEFGMKNHSSISRQVEEVLEMIQVIKTYEGIIDNLNQLENKLLNFLKDG